MSDQPLNLFQSQEGQIDSTQSPSPDLGPLTTFLKDIGKAGVPLGFLKAVPSIDSHSNTLDLRLIHAVDPGPKLVDAGRQGPPPLQSPAISANLVQVAAGGEVTVNGIDFPEARADALYIGWNDTVTGDITGSHIRWSADGKPEQHTVESRKPYDGRNSYILTGLQSDTTYQVRVRDADQMTFTDWSNSITIKTAKNDDVELSLGNGSTVALTTATRDTSGSFKTKVTVPTGTSAGKHTIHASNGSYSATATVEVLGPGQSAQPMLVAIDSENGGVIQVPMHAMLGATLALRGEGFQAGTVALSVQGGASLGQATTAADGTFTGKVQLPHRAGAITLVASQSAIQATLTVSVFAPPT